MQEKICLVNLLVYYYEFIGLLMHVLFPFLSFKLSFHHLAMRELRMVVSTM